MTTTLKARFTINVEGKSRSLFSVSERPDGPGIVGVRTAENYQGPNNSNIPIREQRYTIHPSKHSSQYNQLHHTTILATGLKIHSHHLTDAIKNKSGFAMLFAKLCTDLSLERYLVAANDSYSPITLGEYDPKEQSLFYKVLVAHPENKFELPANDDQNSLTKIDVVQASFKRFRIIVLWRLLPIMSIGIGRFAPWLTFPPESVTGTPIERPTKELMRGKNSEFCVKSFNNTLLALIETMLNPQLAGGLVIL